MAMKLIHNITLPADASFSDAIESARKVLGIDSSVAAHIYRKSIDARKKNDIRTVFSVAFDTDIDDIRLVEEPVYNFQPKKISNMRPCVIGMGPAGLFCAYLLSLYGMKPIVVDRGDCVEKRRNKVEKFWHGGTLDENSNVQFGEGGAGTFSDGKLVTRINDSRCRYVLSVFHDCGAPDNIMIDAKPHIGTDVLEAVTTNLRDKIIQNGGELRYNTKLTDIAYSNGRLTGIYLNGELFACNAAVLATGNAATDTYKMLLEKKLEIAPKPFSVGFRMEHLQSDINKAMYGVEKHRYLPNADYSFSKVFDKTRGEAVYTFCMCPGGYVVNASSEVNGLVTNGMSLNARDGINANSAMLASVCFDTPQDGLNFQRKLERTAFAACGGLAPTISAKGFLDGSVLKYETRVKPSFLPGTSSYDLGKLYPKRVTDMLKTGLFEFGKRICTVEDAVLTGVETRTSAPLRILRDNRSLQSLSVKGLYPCGEGAGYSGGITSSAIDGLKVAEAIIEGIE